MNILFYTLGLFFIHYIYKYGDIISKYKNLMEQKLHKKVVYALNCSFCFAFHCSILLFITKFIPFYYVYCAPVLHLFLNLIFERLKENDK